MTYCQISEIETALKNYEHMIQSDALEGDMREMMCITVHGFYLELIAVNYDNPMIRFAVSVWKHDEDYFFEMQNQSPLLYEQRIYGFQTFKEAQSMIMHITSLLDREV